MPARIFVNYRRSDSQHAALALAEALRWAFVDGEVFFDRSSLLGAQPWPERLNRAVRDARLVIPVIGDRWLKAVDEYGRRRIDHPDDWVRRELEAAIRQRKHLLPVTLDGASVPPRAALDAALARLGTAQSMPVRVDSWNADLHALIERVATLSGAARRPLAAGDASYANGVPIPRPERAQRHRQALTRRNLEARLAELGAWRVETNHHPWAVGGTAEEIARVYEFKSCTNATAFMHESAKVIDSWKTPHHPRWENQWRVVKVWFTTWDVGCRLTELDIDAARRLDRLYRERDPALAG